MADYAHLREVVGGYDDDDLGAQQAHEVAALIRRQKKERGKARVRDVAILEGKKQDIVKALDGARAEEAAAQEALQRAQTKIKMLKDQLVRQADLIAAKMCPTKGRGKRGSRVESNSTEFGFDVKAVNSFDDYEPDRATVVAQKVEQAVSTDAQCCMCDKPAFHQERLDLDGQWYHNWCFKCILCETKLSKYTGNYCRANSQNFCNACFTKSFTASGDYSGFAPKNEITWDTAVVENGIPWGNLHSKVVKGKSTTTIATGGVSLADAPVAAVTASPFSGAAEQPGLEVWRLEDDVPKKKLDQVTKDIPNNHVGVDIHNGRLYSCDIYIFLKTKLQVTGARTAEIFVWTGEDVMATEQATAMSFVPVLKTELIRFPKVPVRCLPQGEGPFFGKFREIFDGDSVKQLECIKGGYAVGADGIDDLLAAAAADFEPRIVTVVVSNGVVQYTELPCQKSSITDSVVCLVETFEIIFQFNGTACSPLNRIEGAKKGEAMLRGIVQDTYATRPSDLRVETIMATRHGTSAQEKVFWDHVTGGAAEWKPKRHHTGRTVAIRTPKSRASVLQHDMQRRASSYEGKSWHVAAASPTMTGRN